MDPRIILEMIKNNKFILLEAVDPIDSDFIKIMYLLYFEFSLKSLDSIDSALRSTYANVPSHDIVKNLFKKLLSEKEKVFNGVNKDFGRIKRKVEDDMSDIISSIQPTFSNEIEKISPKIKADFDSVDKSSNIVDKDNPLGPLELEIDKKVAEALAKDTPAQEDLHTVFNQYIITFHNYVKSVTTLVNGLNDLVLTLLQNTDGSPVVANNPAHKPFNKLVKSSNNMKTVRNGFYSFYNDYLQNGSAKVPYASLRRSYINHFHWLISRKWGSSYRFFQYQEVFVTQTKEIHTMFQKVKKGNPSSIILSLVNDLEVRYYALKRILDPLQTEFNKFYFDFQKYIHYPIMNREEKVIDKLIDWMNPGKSTLYSFYKQRCIPLLSFIKKYYAVFASSHEVFVGVLNRKVDHLRDGDQDEDYILKDADEELRLKYHKIAIETTIWLNQINRITQTAAESDKRMTAQDSEIIKNLMKQIYAKASEILEDPKEFEEWKNSINISQRAKTDKLSDFLEKVVTGRTNTTNDGFVKAQRRVMGRPVVPTKTIKKSEKAIDRNNPAGQNSQFERNNFPPNPDISEPIV